jgi:site-specific DNA recombinase
MPTTFAFYGRVSTEDQQDPESSRNWQIHRGRQLIEPTGGVVVAEFFDAGQSRSVPWKRRPEAQRLLDAFKDPGRPFDAVVIGEPQRAFYGAQFALTFPVFTHYGVALWVPEVGGPVDPGSEAHDLVMTLFGGMSKGERTRIKTRVRSAMGAQAATQGRYLGGRPPYGYRLADAGPHPNPEKRALGARLHRLEADPETAPIIQRIFREFLAGHGYYAIAESLSTDDVPSPSAHDRARNPHRPGRSWGKSSVRAILTNPRYTGFEVWNKQRRDEVLVDLEDVAAGHESVMRWNDKSEWIWSAVPAHEPLITKADFEAVEAMMASRSHTKKGKKKRPEGRTYALRGRVKCAICERRMEGAQIRHESYYRCRYREEYAHTDAFPHPKNVYLRERLVLPQLDTWLAGLFAPERVDHTCELLLAAADDGTQREAQLAGARKAVAACDTKLVRYRALLDNGTDPALVAGWIAEVGAERSLALAKLDQLESAREQLVAADIRQALGELGGLVGALETTDPALRAEFYGAVGLSASYDPGANLLVVTAVPPVGVRYVSEGGLEPPRPCGH